MPDGPPNSLVPGAPPWPPPRLPLPPRRRRPWWASSARATAVAAVAAFALIAVAAYQLDARGGAAPPPPSHQAQASAGRSLEPPGSEVHAATSAPTPEQAARRFADVVASGSFEDLMGSLPPVERALVEAPLGRYLRAVLDRDGIAAADLGPELDLTGARWQVAETVGDRALVVAPGSPTVGATDLPVGDVLAHLFLGLPTARPAEGDEAPSDPGPAGAAALVAVRTGAGWNVSLLESFARAWKGSGGLVELGSSPGAASPRHAADALAFATEADGATASDLLHVLSEADRAVLSWRGIPPSGPVSAGLAERLGPVPAGAEVAAAEPPAPASRLQRVGELLVVEDDGRWYGTLLGELFVLLAENGAG